MKRALLCACALALAGSAQAREQRPFPGSGAGNSYANPSAVIATEIAFAQMAQEKGQWTAFLAYAANDGVIFTPQMAYAQRALKGRANPPVAVKWQAHSVWSSCDGSLMVSHGAWQRPDATGWFTTIWQRQRDGNYRFVLDHGDETAQPIPAPDMLSGLTADCPERVRRSGGGKPPEMPKPPKVSELPPLDPAHRTGKSDDGSLSWDVTVAPDRARKLVVTWKKGGEERQLLSEAVAK